MDEYIENFLGVFENQLHDMSDEEFADVKHGLVSHLLQTDASLRDRIARLWLGVKSNTPQTLTQREELIEQIMKIEKDDLLDFYLSSMKKAGKLSVQVYTSLDGEEVSKAVQSPEANYLGKKTLVINSVSDFVAAVEENQEEAMRWKIREEVVAEETVTVVEKEDTVEETTATVVQ